MTILPENPDLTLFCPFRVTSADTDMEARLRPGALLNMLIQSAIQSADSLGFGFGSLRAEQLFWVLSRINIQVLRPLKWYDTLEVETWPKDVDGLLYLRDFRVWDQNKEVVAKATSAWLAIDFKSKRPRRIEGLDASRFHALKEKHALETRPDKLAAIDADVHGEFTSTYFDIDLNKHVTSTRYLDWIFDMLPMEYMLKAYPTKISINYLKETHPGEHMLIKSTVEEGHIHRFEGIHKSTGQPSYRALIEFAPL